MTSQGRPPERSTADHGWKSPARGRARRSDVRGIHADAQRPCQSLASLGPVRPSELRHDRRPFRHRRSFPSHAQRRWYPETGPPARTASGQRIATSNRAHIAVWTTCHQVRLRRCKSELRTKLIQHIVPLRLISYRQDNFINNSLPTFECAESFLGMLSTWKNNAYESTSVIRQLLRRSPCWLKTGDSAASAFDPASLSSLSTGSDMGALAVFMPVFAEFGERRPNDLYASRKT